MCHESSIECSQKCTKMYPDNLAVVSLNKAHHFLLFKSVTDYSCVAVGVVELDH